MVWIYSIFIVWYIVEHVVSDILPQAILGNLTPFRGGVLPLWTSSHIEPFRAILGVDAVKQEKRNMLPRHVSSNILKMGVKPHNNKWFRLTGIDISVDCCACRAESSVVQNRASVLQLGFATVARGALPKLMGKWGFLMQISCTLRLLRTSMPVCGGVELTHSL